LYETEPNEPSKVVTLEPILTEDEVDALLGDHGSAEEFEPRNQEVADLLQKIYDSPDTGEEPEEPHDDAVERLVQKVAEYVPTTPIEVDGETSYSGPPQTGLIDAPMKSSLENLTVSLPSALFKEGLTPSKKRHLYE
jgi:hypothetical protein